MDSHVGHSRSNLYSMLQQHQGKISAQLEEFLDSVCTGPLPVADRLELRRLVDALCHASKVTGEHLPNTGRVDAAILELAVSGQQKTAIQMDDGVGRVLLVAGAGFEPATFRL